VTADHGLLELERSECLTLLGSVPVGRLVHTARALPAIWPFNFALLPDAVYLRTSPGSGAWRAADGEAVVAFEADDVDVQGRYGWSVVVIGRAGLVTDPATLQRLRGALTPPWATGTREEVVRISLELVDGRRAGGAGRLHDAGVVPLPR
jgi:nitroimidazol reductase NimA-like FMN-containing flavoprotein (pyridoxamine 5'-phosphate oxidase superfamily)